jgi:ABC-type transport system involved in multi-copper enzyme maturation permease subunit
MNYLENGYKEKTMSRRMKISLTVIGILLLMNGVGNIIDNGRILVYDIASTLSGIGFLIVSRIKL